MDGSPPPLLSPSIPRFAPPRTHTRTPSRSPTRHRLADDILSDLSPATTLEAFTNPSGKLKASIEAATPSERAFGLRATLASKKIQEWVDELSGWPWPAEGGSLGFEMPSAKRRKLSIQGDDRGRRNSDGDVQEPKYIGSLLEPEVERYENRIDDITADMEDLNVEEIKRQVLDTHFSPRSRPSSSASNAPPMPSLFASYTRMDDFTAVITATVLQSLPNLSRLTRLMDVWNIRLSVLRKVPPLMLALDDAETALKSGWTAIDKLDDSGSPPPQTGDVHLSRKTFEVMRGVLQDKVTTLGQDLDYMLDTLEGREDTLPDSWLDRMETLENDYGSWVVSGDRKVREGEWARLAKARKEEDDARKLKEAEAAETARRKAEEEARLKAQLDAEAEAAKLKAEQEAQEAARLRAFKEAKEAEAADIARRKTEDDAKEAARLEALRKAEELEAARVLAEEAEVAKLKAEENAQDLARQKALQQAKEAEVTRLIAEQEAESARLQAEKDARELAEQKALDEAAQVEDERLAVQRTQSEDKSQKAAQQASRDAEIAEAERLKADPEAQEAAKREALESVQKETQPDAETPISNRNAKDIEASHQSETVKSALSEQDEQDAGTAEAEAQQDISASESAKPTFIPLDIAEDEPDNQRITECDICEEIRQSKPNSPSRPGLGPTANSGAVRARNFVDSLTTNYDDAVNPQITRYAPFDGEFEASELAIRTTEVVVKQRSTDGFDLASPIHLDDSFPETPTSSTISSAARVLTSPTSEESSPPRSKVLPFGQGFTKLVRASSPTREDGRLLPASTYEVTQISSAPSPAPQTPVRSEFAFDGANDANDSEPAQSRKSGDEEWIVVESPGSGSKVPSDTQDHHSDHESSNSRSSVLLDYSTSEPTPEIFEAQPAEYFASPIKSPRRVAEQGDLEMLTVSVPVTPQPVKTVSDAQDSTTTKSAASVATNRQSRESTNSILSPVAEESLLRSTDLDLDGRCDACDVSVRDLQALETDSSNDTDLSVLAHKTSFTRIDSPIRRISIPRRESISSDASTIIHGRVGESLSSTVASPISDDATESSFEQSPSAGRIGHRSVKSYDISPPNSPPPGLAKRPSLFLPTTPGLSPSIDPTTPLPDSMPSTPLDAPIFGNIDVSTVPMISSPKKPSTDDQMQQQISSLLESIPARIRLTTEPNETPFTSQTLRPKKTRRSITPSFRSSSSMSNYSTTSRAPTPSFTLAPAFGKTSSRPRPQSSNPEIKLYHLSRSTGEAPIKLFVRLVGEHGERVMVRVGGGWADLGEYLKEYASHHGRRSAVDAGDKVQIQDLPSRNVSSSSTATLRGNGNGNSMNGRSTPDPRPQSVMERDRPGSSLFVRKTRRSVGEYSSSSSSNTTTAASMFDPSRAPSTPLPTTSSLHRNLVSTPPSTISSNSNSGEKDRNARSSSRLSWTSDDGKASLALGLAGPKSKNVTISERDQEWVESMKEKVRLASAEKEKREKARDRDSGVGMVGSGGLKGKGEGREGKGEGSGRESRASFGEMEKVGGTKRLFRRGV